MADFIKFLGKNNRNSFYLRDFRNNYRFRPDVNPPRQQFAGYVNFIFNRNLPEFLNLEKATFKTSISSLIRSSTLPGVQFRTQKKNAYNKPRIVQTGVDFNAIDIRVFDTINNEWLTTLMRYFAYLYTNPRNRSGTDRDVKGMTRFEDEISENATFNSLEAGLDLQQDAHFFERVDIILYHGGRGVQYSLSDPVISGFQNNSLDYASSDFMEFNLQLEYENFTVHDILNFDLTAVDLDRFEKVGSLDFKTENIIVQPIALQKETPLDFLGQHSNSGEGDRKRATQEDSYSRGDAFQGSDPHAHHQNKAVKFFKRLIDNVANDGDGVKAGTPTYQRLTNPLTDGEGAGGFFGKLVSTAVNAKIHGADVGDAVENFAIGAVADAVYNAAPKRSNDSEEEGS